MIRLLFSSSRLTNQVSAEIVGLRAIGYNTGYGSLTGGRLPVALKLSPTNHSGAPSLRCVPEISSSTLPGHVYLCLRTPMVNGYVILCISVRCNSDERLNPTFIDFSSGF